MLKSVDQRLETCFHGSQSEVSDDHRHCEHISEKYTYKALLSSTTDSLYDRHGPSKHNIDIPCVRPNGCGEQVSIKEMHFSIAPAQTAWL